MYFSSFFRSARDSEDEDDEDKRGRSCTLLYQHAMIRVLTHFIAEPADPRSPTSFMLGSDWQVDITDMVWDFLKVEDPQIAQLLDRKVLVGQGTGMTTIQVWLGFCVYLQISSSSKKQLLIAAEALSRCGRGCHHSDETDGLFKARLLPSPIYTSAASTTPHFCRQACPHLPSLLHVHPGHLE